jgi:ABC-type sugar transport system substrate-binding protein
VSGTTTVDYPGLDTIIRNQSGAGAQGLVAPGPTAVARVLLQIGKPFATFDQCDVTLKMLCVDQDGVASGKILGKALLQLLGGSTASGTVLMGICVAGLPVMVNRLAGVRDALAVDHKLHILPVFTTSGEPSQNAPVWRAEVAAHPNATALVGSCSTDTTSIGAVNAEHGDKYIAVGYDVTPETLAVVKNGSVKITVGQGSYLQGYWTVEATINSLRSGKPVPTGWINPGTELITKANVASHLSFTGSPTAEHQYYSKQIHTNLGTIIRPINSQSS